MHLLLSLLINGTSVPQPVLGWLADFGTSPWPSVKNAVTVLVRDQVMSSYVYAYGVDVDNQRVVFTVVCDKKNKYHECLDFVTAEQTMGLLRVRFGDAGHLQNAPRSPGSVGPRGDDELPGSKASLTALLSLAKTIAALR